jgi:hypothetical protein
MAITSRVNLKNSLEDGDTLTGDNLANLIDSFLHLSDTSAQTVAGPVTFTGSATFTNINAADIDTSSFNVGRIETGELLTSGLSASFVTIASTLTVTGSAQMADINCNDIDTSSMNFRNIEGGSIITSAFRATNNVSSIGTWSNSATFVSCISAFLTASSLSVHGVNFEVDTTLAAVTGDGSAVPASVAGFIIVNIAGTERRIPYFSGS